MKDLCERQLQEQERAMLPSIFRDLPYGQRFIERQTGVSKRASLLHLCGKEFSRATHGPRTWRSNGGSVPLRAARPCSTGVVSA